MGNAQHLQDDVRLASKQIDGLKELATQIQMYYGERGMDEIPEALLLSVRMALRLADTIFRASIHSKPEMLAGQWENHLYALLDAIRQYEEHKDGFFMIKEKPDAA